MTAPAARAPDLLTQTEVCARLGISAQTWWCWRKAKRTPEAIVMPSGRLKWRRADIDKLVGDREETSRRYFTSAYRRPA